MYQQLLDPISDFLTEGSQHTFHFAKTFCRLIKFSLKNKKYVAVSFIGVVASSLLLITAPKVCGDIIDDLQSQDYQSSNIWLLVGMVALISLFVFLKTYSLNRLAFKSVADLQVQCLKLVLNIKHQCLTHKTQLRQAIANNQQNLEPLTGAVMANSIKIVLQFIVRVIIIFWLSWKVGMVIIWVIPTVIIFFIAYICLFLSQSRKIHAHEKSAHRLLESIMETIVYRQFFEQSINCYRKEQQARQKINKRLSLIFGISMGLYYIVFYGMILAILLKGMSLIRKQQISFGQLTSVVLYSFSLADGLIELKNDINRILLSIYKYQVIFGILDQQIQNKCQIFKDDQCPLAFKNVTCSRVVQQKKLQILNSNLQIRSGQTVGLISEGKVLDQIVIPLMNGSILPEKGQISRGVKNIYVISKKSLVTKGNVLQNITLQNNIGTEQVQKILQDLGVSQFKNYLNFTLNQAESILQKANLRLIIQFSRFLLRGKGLLVIELDKLTQQQTQRAVSLSKMSGSTVVLLSQTKIEGIQCFDI